MELATSLDLQAFRTFWKHNLCISPSSFFQNRFQRISPSHTRKCMEQFAGSKLHYSVGTDKVSGNRFTHHPQSEEASEARVLSHAQPTDDDTVILSLNAKPDRLLHVDEEEAAGNGEANDDDYLDLTVPPNHRSGYVAVIGKPNVGKSTLLNQMIGQKLSIVTHKPQTTRHRILGLCSAPDYQMVLYDTPGVIQKTMHKLDAMMMKNVRTAAINADCILIVIDACVVPGKVDDVMEGGTSDVREKPPTLLVLNKKDLIKPGEISKRIQWYATFGGADHVLPISAKYGDGVEDVKNWIISKLPYGPAYYPKDIISEHPERFFVAEIVREKIFMQYRQEIPYACQVNVVNYISRPTSKHFIEIEIVVEKEAQKIILIGKEGKALKLLATAARLDIEEFLQKQVYLEIKVKVKPNWRQDEDLLKQFGYSGRIRPL